MFRPYQIPEGFYDQGFVYVYDAAALLTNGTSPQNLAVPMDGQADFILRRVYGLGTVASKILLRNENQTPLSLAAVTVPYDWPIVPEVKYSKTAAIGFDLTTVSIAQNAGGLNPAVKYGQLIFQGVRRFTGKFDDPTPYTYYVKPYAYKLTDDTSGYVSVDWYGLINSGAGAGAERPRLYAREVRTHDFELHYIAIQRTDSAGAANPTHNLKIQVQDRLQRNLFQAPVVDYFMGDKNFDGEFTNGVFPVPPEVYPVGSAIRLELTSLLTTQNVPGGFPGTPATFEITLGGVQRVRC